MAKTTNNKGALTIMIIILIILGLSAAGIGYYLYTIQDVTPQESNASNFETDNLCKEILVLEQSYDQPHRLNGDTKHPVDHILSKDDGNTTHDLDTRYVVDPILAKEDGYNILYDGYTRVIESNSKQKPILLSNSMFIAIFNPLLTDNNPKYTDAIFTINGKESTIEIIRFDELQPSNRAAIQEYYRNKGITLKQLSTMSFAKHRAIKSIERPSTINITVKGNITSLGNQTNSTSCAGLFKVFKSPVTTTDSHGCHPSTGEKWCESAKKCSDVCLDETDEHGCALLSGELWCETIQKCMQVESTNLCPVQDTDYSYLSLKLTADKSEIATTSPDNALTLTMTIKNNDLPIDSDKSIGEYLTDPSLKDERINSFSSTIPEGFTYIPNTTTIDDEDVTDSIISFDEDTNTITWEGEDSWLLPQEKTLVLKYAILASEDVTEENFKISATVNTEDLPMHPENTSDTLAISLNSDTETQAGGGDDGEATPTTSNLAVTIAGSTTCVERISPSNTVSLTISITNNDTDSENISKIVNKLPLGFTYTTGSTLINGATIGDTNLLTITETGSTQELTWDPAEDWTLLSGQTMTLRLTAIAADSALTGGNQNEAVVTPLNTPVSAENLRATYVITVAQTCTNPKTGLFDTMIGRIMASMLLIVTAVIFYKSNNSQKVSEQILSSKSINQINKVSTNTKRSFRLLGLKLTHPRKFFEESFEESQKKKSK